MYNYCEKKEIYKDNLILNIDISNENSWKSDNLYVINSLNKWEKAVSKEQTLIDFGLTSYDNGLANSMDQCLYIENNNTDLKLYRIGANDISGNTNYFDYQVSGVTNNNQIGNYLQLNGGYYQTFFKLEGYEYELLPARFMSGFTIETLIKIDNVSQGIFLYLGTRSEDKYNPYFSGETFLNEENNFDGIMTSENNFLNAYLDEKILNNNFRNYEEDKFSIKKIQTQQIENLKNNVIAFEITEDKKIKIKRIDNDGYLKEYYSDKNLNLNWNLISIVYIPNIELPEYNDKYNCFDLRKGVLKLYVNGYLFWKIDDFEEFYFKPLNNHKEKQIGVPYNISWGGGSFGLKHSYHYDKNIVNIYENNDILYINNKFTVYGNANLGYDSLNESINLNISNGTNILIEYNDFIEVLSGHKYKLSCLVNENIYNYFIDEGEIKFKIKSNFKDYELLDNFVYSTKRVNSKWTEIIFEFRIGKDCNYYYFYPQIEIISEKGFIQNSNLKIKNWIIETTNRLTKDLSKDNLYIQKYFDSSFIGGIQKLRIYDKPLNNDEILNNSKVESKNEYYIKNNIGGRIIYI